MRSTSLAAYKSQDVKKIPSHTGYFADKAGNVYSGKSGELKLLKINMQHGYKYICLCENNVKKNYTVHRLILETFVGVRPEGMQACHGVGGRLDNSIANLRWDSGSVNNKEDKLRDGKLLRGERNPSAALKNNQISIIRGLISEGRTLQSIADQYEVTQQTIWRIKHGKTWSTVGAV